SSRVELVGADANFGTKAKLAAVVESSTRVDHHRTTIDLAGELARGGEAFGNDRIGVVGAVMIDVLDCLVERVDDLDRDGGTEELGPVVLVGRSRRPTNERAGARATADGYFMRFKGSGHPREKLAGHGDVDEQRLGGVADTHPLALAVDDDRLGHGMVGRLVDVDMAVAVEVLDDRHRRFGNDATNEAFTSARDGDVDKV